MEPPKWVVEEIERIHPQVRLGWIGEPRIDDDGTFTADEGFFMLIQLYHPHDADHTLHYPWKDNGPVFGKPYSRDKWVPMIIYPVHPEDVYSGKMLEELRENMQPIKERELKAAAADDAAYEKQMDDLSEEAGKELWKMAGDGAPIVARKFLDKDQEALLHGDVDLTAGDKEVDRIKHFEGTGKLR